MAIAGAFDSDYSVGAMDGVEILDVVRAPPKADRFWGAAIVLPKMGERRDHDALVLAGGIALDACGYTVPKGQP